MRRLPVIARRGLGVAVVAFAVGACAKEERTVDSATGSRTPTPTNSASMMRKGLPGALAKPLDSYSGAEFYDFIQRLSFGHGSDHTRDCVGNPACAGPTPTMRTAVRVDAVEAQDSLGVDAVPTHGVVAIRAINHGKLTEARYGMKSGEGLQYYLVVLPGTAREAKWRLEELDAKARRHAAIATGTFTACPHGGSFVPSGIRASFSTCEKAHPGSTRSDALNTRFLTDPLWVECMTGCCIVK